MARARDLILKPKDLRPCTVTALDGETLMSFGLRLLPSSDTRAVVVGAREYARAAGSTDPKPDDVMYVRGLWVHTILAACMDTDAPAERYFSDVEQIERLLDDARLAYVFQAQRDYQAEYAPSPEGIAPEEFPVLVAAITEEWKKGGDPERPLASLPPRKLRSFTSQLAYTLSLQTEMLSQLGSPSSRISDSSMSTGSSAPSSEKAA